MATQVEETEGHSLTGGKRAPGAGWKRVQRYMKDESDKKKTATRKWEDLTATQKWEDLTKRMKTGVADFFGVADKSESEKLLSQRKWENRSKHLMASSFIFGHQAVRRPEQPVVWQESSTDEPDRGLLTDQLSKRMQRDRPDARPTRQNVWIMTFDGVKNLWSGKPSSKVTTHPRSFAPSCLKAAKKVCRPVLDDDFFEYSSPKRRPFVMKTEATGGVGDFDEPDIGVRTDLGKRTAKFFQNGLVIRKGKDVTIDKALLKGKDVPDSGAKTGLKRMSSDIFEDMVDNTNRREIGVGFVGKWLDWDYNYSPLLRDPEVRKQMDNLAADQHRPFFTYWVTFVQIVCFIFAVAVYGIAPIGVSETRIEAEILKPSLSIEIVHYIEPDNLWIGPRQADLIHLGAKYSPCMRRDSNIEQAVTEDRLKESKTACCIRNDGSGCVQTQESLCSRTLSTWLKWGVKNTTGTGGRKSGSVCGQDPKYCKNPVSLSPYEWPDDISQWPVCKENVLVSKKEDDKHMKCEILGRPCCVGIQGQCIITTREFCEFRRGYFHEEAALCSQVSCMSEVCGMIPFYNPEKPDQFYRLWTSLFLHAGLFQLLISVVFQWFIMRDLEKLAGCWRIGTVYIMSGIAGSLGSAIFIPYHVEAGPSGSQFGILACVFVEVIQNWPVIGKPCWTLGKLTLILLSLFVLGLLPMIDNWAHLFGFIFGFLLAFALFPYVTFSVLDRQRKLAGIIICLVTTVAMFLILVLLFYVIPIYKCPNCEYFNCIPFTPTFCKSMEVKITRNDEF